MQINLGFTYHFIKNLILSSFIIWGIGILDFYIRIYSLAAVHVWIIPFLCSVLLLVVHKLFFDDIPIISIIIVVLCLSAFNIIDAFSLHCDKDIQQSYILRVINFPSSVFLLYYTITSYWRRFDKKQQTIILLVFLVILWSMNFMDYGIFRIFNLIVSSF
ncbi:hypothetical protein CYV15_04335 [Riemerella anatipestifer]|nr:hypothetical protein Riean_1778 [Riemerella anatipestifer ATCC 11845 = DSM 15868]ADZ11563.1 hypothetical protein RIA_0394 [Riemerella anatipestifer RA-GD]MDD1524800.1 hypothetical protein [Riemerella anatipestifer]MRM92227.1 hypothetical protein [Riemerella anatipestifer]MRN04259.1 hypothetical protein [Riemerella anatipestifer]